MMTKILLSIAAGIFIGAFAVEILNRKNPELTKKIEEKAKDAVDALAAATETFKSHIDVKPVSPKLKPVH